MDIASLNVSQPRTFAAVLAQAVERHGRLDVLMDNFGIVAPEDAEARP